MRVCQAHDGNPNVPVPLEFREQIARAGRRIGRAGMTSPSMTGCHGIMLIATSCPNDSGRDRR